MNKFKQWKQAMKNTPPERLLKINMQGHVLQSIGILVVCGILWYTRVMWWLTLIFIFALWNNYSGFISSYQQYSQIKDLRKELNLKTPEIKSPHLKKAELIKKEFGRLPAFCSALVSAVIAYMIIGGFDGSWLIKILKVIISFVILMVSYYILYFQLFYKLARRLNK